MSAHPSKLCFVVSEWLGVPHLREPRPVILVADDTELILRMLRRILGVNGYDVITAGDGAEALEVLRANATVVRLALVDLNMPRLNGIEFCLALRGDPAIARIPVVLLTGADEYTAREQAPVDGVVTKPFHIAELLAVVSQLVPVDTTTPAERAR